AAALIGQEENLFEVQSLANTSSRRKIFNLCVEKKWVLTQLTPLETKLEDIFRNLTLN
ncbi:MAG: gliding motility-associated ABC transporter ATP-binding subunit GldA, partial [Arenibacter sp.]|nr:gliding motility-associated ABC transporter ATP-binding subunit GldA [Arenibacter sp.]